MKKDIKIGKHIIGENHPTYFIADIAANHDGDIERAKSLIKLAKESRCFYRFIYFKGFHASRSWHISNNTL